MRQCDWLLKGTYATDKNGDVYFRWDCTDEHPIKLDKVKYYWEKDKIGSSNYYYYVQIGKNLRAVHCIIARNYPEICGDWFEGAVVHHINGIKYDNRPENLLVMSENKHTKWHTNTRIEFDGKVYSSFMYCTRHTGFPYQYIITHPSLKILGKYDERLLAK